MDPDDTLTFFISTLPDPQRTAASSSRTSKVAAPTAAPTNAGIGAVANEGKERNDNEALDFLIGKGGFKHLDQLLPPPANNDAIIFYTIMNMILVEHAVAFSTCSERCPTKYNACHKCSFLSSSALGKKGSPPPPPTTVHGGDFLMETRDKDASQTLPCWPETSSQVSHINKLWTQH
jgi:hypothetical protein